MTEFTNINKVIFGKFFGQKYNNKNGLNPYLYGENQTSEIMENSREKSQNNST